MFLLIPNSLQIKATAESGFTFQYVSINTQCEVYRVAHYGTLHSNMFLLIPAVVASPLSFVPSLHSNMFLLIHEKTCTLGWAQNYFTFQYVSINTLRQIDDQKLYEPLHSNMFLLIR